MLFKPDSQPPNAGALQLRVNELTEILAVPPLPNRREHARQEWRVARGRMEEAAELRNAAARLAPPRPGIEIDPKLQSAQDAFEVAARKVELAGREHEAARKAEEQWFEDKMSPAIDAATPTLAGVLQLLDEALQPVSELYLFAEQRQLPSRQMCAPLFSLHQTLRG